MPRSSKLLGVSVNLSAAQREKLHLAAGLDGRSLSNFFLMRGIEWAEERGIKFSTAERTLPTMGPTRTFASGTRSKKNTRRA